jgi:hypothetical protein
MVLRQVERFRDVGKNMARMEADYPDESPDMMRLAFAAIRAGNRHGDIRALRRMFIDDRPRYEALLKAVEKEEEQWERATDTQLANPDLATPDTDEEYEADTDEPPGPVVPKYPVQQVNERIKNAVDGFVAANTLNVKSALYQAWSRLETLDAAKVEQAVGDDLEGDAKRLLEQILDWARDIEAAFKK